MRFNCPKCGKAVDVEGHSVGSTFECPHCSANIKYSPDKIYAGRLLAGFELQELLGVGGMGEVWLAYQRSMDRQVAIKILSPHLSNDKSFVDNFLEEVKLAAKLEHPNIVSAFDAGVEDDIYYLAMSYVPGETFATRIAREKKLPENEIRKIALQVSRALDYAWKKFRILHRDVNPSNIMLTPDGTIKLMDMGISRNMEEDKGEIEESLVGTPNYISPEQIRGDERLDVRSDIYSLGMTLYHLSTGLLPFDGEDTYDILHKHLNERLPAVNTLNPQISKPCAQLIERMTEKEREKRPKSWDAVMSAIQDLAEQGEAASAGPGSGTLNQDASHKQVTISREHLKKVHEEHLRGAKANEKKSALPFLVVLLAMVAASAVLALKVLEKRELGQAGLNLMVLDTPEIGPASTDVGPEDIVAKRSSDEGDAKDIGKARIHAAAGDYAGAVNVYSQYADPFAEETLARRQRLAEGFSEDVDVEGSRYGATEETGSRLAELDKFLGDVARDLCDANLSEVVMKCNSIEQRPGDSKVKEVAKDIKMYVEEIRSSDRYVNDALSSGRVANIVINADGHDREVGVKVDDGRLLAEVRQGRGLAYFPFTLRQIPTEEKYRILEGEVDQISRELYMGIYKLKHTMFNKAIDHFERTGILSEHLVNRVNRIAAEVEEKKAEGSVISLLRSVSILGPEDELDWDHLTSEESFRGLSKQAAELLGRQLLHLQEVLADTDFMETNADHIKYIREMIASMEFRDPSETRFDDISLPSLASERSFYEPILRARRSRGVPIPCNPRGHGRGIIPEAIDEKISSNMILIIQKGDYGNRGIEITRKRSLTIKAEAGVVNCNIKILDSQDINIQGVKVEKIEIDRSQYVIVDSEIAELRSFNSTGQIHNSRIVNAVCSREVIFDHCLVNSIGVRDSNKILFRNSILYGSVRSPWGSQYSFVPCFRWLQDQQSKIGLMNSIIYTEGPIGVVVNHASRLERVDRWANDEDARLFHKMSDMQDRLELNNSIFEDPRMLKPNEQDFSLRFSSPARKASISGKNDLGPSPDLRPFHL